MFSWRVTFILSRYRVPEVMTSTFPPHPPPFLFPPSSTTLFLSLSLSLPSFSFDSSSRAVSRKRRSVNIYGFVFPDGPILFELAPVWETRVRPAKTRPSLPSQPVGFGGYFGRSGSHDKTRKRTAPATLSHDLSPVDLLFTGQRGRQMKVTPEQIRTVIEK